MNGLGDDAFTGVSNEDNGGAFGQYSFFGNLGEEVGGLEGGLEGALEDGLEAPPEEELPDPDAVIDADEDLSYASMFAAAALPKSPIDDDLLEPAIPAPRSQPELTPIQPPKPKLGSIALGSLLAATTPSESAFSTGSMSPFLNTPGSAASPLNLPYPQPPRALNAPLAPSQLQPSSGPPQPKAMTPQELEAQLRGGARPYGSMGPPPGMHIGMGMQLGMGPPPPPPGAGMPPPPFPGMPGPPPGFHSMGPPPPPGPFMPRAGVFTPEMIMQQQHQQMQPPPPGMQQQQPMQPPPGVAFPFEGPPHMQQQQMQQQYQQQQMQQMPPQGFARPPPPPPALGAGPPRGPPPGMYLGPHGVPPGGPRPPSSHPHANLAQRLRALNLAERQDVHRPSLRRRYSSQCMAQDDIETILHMQWRPLHQGAPYVEDYYYQAFVFKYYGKRNRRSFTPESVRELAPTEKVAPDEVAFVRLDGLGRVPFSNVRRPRPLMDVTPEDMRKAAASGEGSEREKEEVARGQGVTSRRLDEEPMLAARIMIEDCMALILDVQDIDRIFTAAAATRERIQNEAALRQRRVLLMDGLTASLRLPEAPMEKEKNAEQTDGAAAASDGVFLRLLALPKGQNLAARVLVELYPPQEAAQGGEKSNGDAAATAASEPNLRILWAILRNLRALFGGMVASKAAASHGKAGAAAAAASAQAATSKVAAAAADVIKRLHSRQAVCNCLSAVVHGDLDAAKASPDDPEAVLLPLFAPGIESAANHHFPWLVDVLTALLQRGAEFELSTAVEGGSRDATDLSTWRKDFGALYTAVVAHVEALAAAVGAAKEEGDAEVAGEVKALVPVELARNLLQHCSAERKERLKGTLTAMGL